MMVLINLAVRGIYHHKLYEEQDILMLLKLSVSRFLGAGGNVFTRLNFNLLSTLRWWATVGKWSPKECCWLLQTTNGRTVVAVIRCAASPPEASGV